MTEAMFIITTFIVGGIVGWSGALVFSSRIERIFSPLRERHDAMRDRVNEQLVRGARYTDHRFRP